MFLSSEITKAMKSIECHPNRNNFFSTETHPR
jgi:hypothetical protein